MKNKKEVRGKRNTGFVGFLYVMSAILALVFVFMLISNISYIRSYIASYGMSAGDIIAESVQYIIKGSLNYFVYALLVFCAAKVLSIVSTNCKDADFEEDNYRFEPDEVISRLGASKEKEKTVGTKIVEEATKGK